MAYQSDGSEEDDGYWSSDFEVAAGFNLLDIYGCDSRLEHLGFVPGFRPSWDLKEAFRELVQNWKDAMLESYPEEFNNPPAPFETKFTHSQTNRRVVVEALGPKTRKRLGFILFDYDADGLSKPGMKGGLRIVNFGANLRFSALGTGSTSKRGKMNQAGQHGEGLKVAALVFRRGGYNVRIESSGCKWSFIWKRGKLACHVKRIPHKTLEKQGRRGNKTDLVHYPGEDVCLVVGAQGRETQQYNGRHKGQKIRLEDFLDWLKVLLYINPPAAMVRTPHGDIILDRRYRNKLYLKGLLVVDGNAERSRDSYAYGYNFADGYAPHERDQIYHSTGSGQHCEEAEAIAGIWESAIMAPRAGPELLMEYTQLLLDSFNEKRDVKFDSVQSPLSAPMARKVWEQMRRRTSDSQGRSGFFYSSEEGGTAIRIIEHSFKQCPVPLHPGLWKALRNYQICKTPQEELEARFSQVRETKASTDIFPAHVNWMLRCLLQSEPVTEDINLKFVHGENLEIDEAYSGNTWMVHDKWLTYDGTHENTYCDEHKPDNQHVFACDHAVLDLWAMLIMQLRKANHPQVTFQEAQLRGKARAKLSQMPRAVKCTPNSWGGQLEVLWQSVASHLHRHKSTRIVLHSNDCRFYHRTGLEHGPEAPFNGGRCACPSQTQSTGFGAVTFENLDPKLSYKPIASSDVEGAFNAIPPPIAYPRVADVIRKSRPRPAFRSGSVHSHATTPATVRARADNASAYSNYQRPSVAEYNDDNDMEIDVESADHVSAAPTNDPSHRPHAVANGTGTGLTASRRVSRRSELADFIDDRDASVAPPSEASYHPSEAHCQPSEAWHQPSEGTRMTNRESTHETIATPLEVHMDDSGSRSLYASPTPDRARSHIPPSRAETSNGLSQDIPNSVRSEMSSPEAGISTFDQPDVDHRVRMEIDPVRAVSFMPLRLLPLPREVTNRARDEMPPPQIDRKTFTIGNKIAHNSLDWGGKFPGSHEFYSAHNSMNVLIAIPKPTEKSGNGKRAGDNITDLSSPARRPRTDVDPKRIPSASTSSAPRLLTPRRLKTPTLMTAAKANQAPSVVRSTSMTPAQDRQVTYRY